MRHWLPDAELDAHPIASWLMQLGFDAWLRAFYEREIVLPENFHIAPSTLIASNHQRDVDGPMLGLVLAQRRGLRFAWPLPFYAAREDLFRPGILARLTVAWPHPISAFLGRLSLAWFFPLGRAEPMRRVREYTLGEALRALQDAGLGDADAASLLNARGRRELGVSGATPLHEALAQASPAALEQWWGLRRLSTHAIGTLAPGFRATVDAHLEHFAGRLDRGRSVYFAPEGTISKDGHFCRVRAGFFRLVHKTRQPPWVQPMGLAYDTLAPGRSRVVVKVGTHFRADTALSRCDFNASLRRTILDLAPITPSHLLAHWLLHGPAAFTLDEMMAWMERGLDAVRGVHQAIDPLFARKSIASLVRGRLRWLERKGLILRAGYSLRNTCSRNVAPGWQTPAHIVRFLDNQLADIIPDRERALPC